MNPITPIKIVKGDKVTLKYRIEEDGSPKDITDVTFKFAVKEKLDDTSYKISPVDGVIDDAANGEFSFVVTVPDETFLGVFEIAMYDASSNKTVISPPLGEAFRVVESIID